MKLKNFFYDSCNKKVDMYIGVVIWFEYNKLQNICMFMYEFSEKNWFILKIFMKKT